VAGVAGDNGVAEMRFLCRISSNTMRAWGGGRTPESVYATAEARPDLTRRGWRPEGPAGRCPCAGGKPGRRLPSGPVVGGGSKWRGTGKLSWWWRVA
jgi:hypothetical protein